MKIISDYKELQGQTFPTVEACAEAEAAIDKQKTEKAAANKQYDDAVVAARAKLEAARENLKAANASAEKIVDEANAKVKEIMCPARKAVREAEHELGMAIAEYSKNVGPYRMEIKNVDPSNIDMVVHDILKGLFG